MKIHDDMRTEPCGVTCGSASRDGLAQELPGRSTAINCRWHRAIPAAVHAPSPRRPRPRRLLLRPRRARARRARAGSMGGDGGHCWVLECGVSTDGSVGSLAEVMRQCAKEGAMLRGLEGMSSSMTGSRSSRGSRAAAQELHQVGDGPRRHGGRRPADRGVPGGRQRPGRREPRRASRSSRRRARPTRSPMAAPHRPEGGCSRAPRRWFERARWFVLCVCACPSLGALMYFIRLYRPSLSALSLTAVQPCSRAAPARGRLRNFSSDEKPRRHDNECRR